MLCSFPDVLENIKQKTISRMKVGWFDHSRDSYDMRKVEIRAYCIFQRMLGIRLSIKHELRNI